MIKNINKSAIYIIIFEFKTCYIIREFLHFETTQRQLLAEIITIF